MHGHLQFLHCELEGACVQPSNLKNDAQKPPAKCSDPANLNFWDLSHPASPASLEQALERHRWGVPSLTDIYPIPSHQVYPSSLLGFRESPQAFFDWGPRTSVLRSDLPCSHPTIFYQCLGLPLVSTSTPGISELGTWEPLDKPGTGSQEPRRLYSPLSAVTPEPSA